jgi:hypothetical protein
MAFRDDFISWKYEGKRPSGRQWRGWKDNIKTYLPTYLLHGAEYYLKS